MVDGKIIYVLTEYQEKYVKDFINAKEKYFNIKISSADFYALRDAYFLAALTLAISISESFIEEKDDEDDI